MILNKKIDNRDDKVRICILGIGVIGTTYGYVFQKAGHEIEHLVRESKRSALPKQITVDLLDGRYDHKGKEKTGTYDIVLAEPSTSYDFILVSVASGNLKNAIDTISKHRLKGTIILFCNFWNTRSEIVEMLGDFQYIIAFPTAGGCMEHDRLNCVLFDHITMEGEEKANISNYEKLMELLKSTNIKAEVPYDMVEWIWLHMAINAGVTSTAAHNGDIENPRQLAINLMGNARALSETVKTIRETLNVVASRDVDLKKYNNEIMPYKIPACIAGIVMKRMFAGNELTRRIMTLHNDIQDILYGCTCIYDTGKKNGLELPLFYQKIDRIAASTKD